MMIRPLLLVLSTLLVAATPLSPAQRFGELFRAVQMQRPVVTAFPQSPVTRALAVVADNLVDVLTMVAAALVVEADQVTYLDHPIPAEVVVVDQADQVL